MPEIKIPVELPTIDLGTILPLLVLVVLAALVIVALIVLRLIKSRAFGLAIVAGIIILGSGTIVGGLQALAVLAGVGGFVAVLLVIALGRHPDVLDLVRDATKHEQIPAGWAQPIDQPRQPIMAAPKQTAERLPAPRGDTDRWGF